MTLLPLRLPKAIHRHVGLLWLCCFFTLAVGQMAGTAADLPVPSPFLAPSISTSIPTSTSLPTSLPTSLLPSLDSVVTRVLEAEGEQAGQGSSFNLLYPSSIVQGEEFILYINRIAADSTVLFALTSPEGAVEVGSVRASLLGSVRIVRQLPQLGIWRWDIQQAGQSQTLQVEVRSSQPHRTSEAELSLSLEQGVLQASGAVSWRLAFPEGSGSSHSFIRELAAEGDTIYLAHGNSLLKIASETGIIRQRWLLPNAALELRSAGAGGIIVKVMLDGEERALLIERGRLTEALPFADEAEIFDWLANEAKVSDIAQRLEQDQSQPWLYARRASQLSDAAEQEALFSAALQHAQAFYTLADLSTLFYQQGFETLAVRAFDAAMEDFLVRGYDPRLLSHLDYVRRYHFPFDALEEALEQENLPASRFFAERLWWAAPNLPEAKPLYSRYSQQLAQAGRQDQARVWSARAEAPSSTKNIFTKTPLLPVKDGWQPQQAGRQVWVRWGQPLLLQLSQAGWGLVLALLGSFLLLCLVLSQKYQAMQVNQGGWGLRFWHFFERLNAVFLLLLLAALLFLLPWGQQLQSLPASLQSGRWAQDVLAALPVDIAALTTASSVQSTVQSSAQSSAQSTVQQDDVLAYAERYDVTVQPIMGLEALQQELGGDMASHWQRLRTAPLASVDALAPASFMNNKFMDGKFMDGKAEPWLWRGLCLLYALILLLFFLSLFLPRAKGSAHCARPWHFYILALLLAGTGLCNMLWGGALLLAWTLLSYEAVAQWLAQSSWISLPLPSFGLATESLRRAFMVLYAINLLMLWLEAGLHQRVRRKVTRPLLAGTGRKRGAMKQTQESAEMLPSGKYQVLRADEPQVWE